MEEKMFAVFILSHGRAKDVKTVDLLKKGNYTGDWYIVIDDEDDQESIYRSLYGDHILQFCKIAEAEKTDTGDNEDDRRVGVFARNAIQDFARDMGYKYHLQLDDDFSSITYRWDKGGGKLGNARCKQLDKLFGYLVEYMENTSITWLSLSLNSYYIGGTKHPNWGKGIIPKTMGSFLMRRDDPVKFRMRMNDDITTTVLNWSRGKICFSVMRLKVDTPATQMEKGGMTDIYRDDGTYRKSFYSVLCCPSFCTVGKPGIMSKRMHHIIEWNNCVPKILNEKWKKHV